MSFPPYPAYKNSGSDRLGDVPAHWEVVPCRAIVDECVEKNDLVKVTQYLSLMANIGIIRYEDKGDVGNKKPDDLSKCKIVKKGDLVINSMNYGIGSYGLSPLDGICSPVYIVLDPKDDVIQERFALRIFEEKEFQAFAQSFGNGILAHRSAIGWDDLKNIPVALPPLPEQNLLSSFLDHETARIDALIEEQQRLIELLKEKRQAVISHAVTKGLDPTVPMKDSGVEWLGEVPAHWSVSRLKYHSTKIGDGLHSTPEYDDAGDYFFVNGNNLVGGSICITPATRQVNRQEFLKHRVLLDSSTILISINGTIGNLALYSGEPVILGKSAAYINCAKSLSPRFCLYLFSSGQIKRFFESQLTGTTIYNLSLRTIAETPTPLPSIDEQNCIVEFLGRQVDEFDELIDNAMRLSQLLQERRSALISAAVTGKIDVRGWQSSVSTQAPESAVAEAH
ncbi:restriction endonuclease subunit S [Halopseudomonas oceani]|uniref:restriction endonuclease subunit S n=1 Tax=Halopseudomonas oceani TaxID=1708783 RepID=UPI002AA69F83|nr:restriction endonuclease subunit S [Halopseudomonas oceani]